MRFRRYLQLFFFCALPALAVLAAVPQTHGPTAEQQVESQAAALVRSHHYPQALQVLAPALRRHPDSPQLLTIEGLAASLAGNNTAALQALRRAVHADPSFLPALRAEAQVLDQQHSPELAAVLQDILKQDPGDNTARAMLASVQAARGSCAAALANYRQLAGGEAAPQARCLFTLGHYADAARIYARLLEQAPTSTADRYDLGLAQLRAGDAPAASATLEPMADADTADADTLSLASDAAEAAGDTPRAVALLRRAIVLNPENADSYVRFAEICMAHESYQPGIDMITSGLARLPHDPALYLARGMLYGGEASYAKAEADFRDAELYDPAHGTGAYGVGLVQLQNNQPKAALASTRAALRQHPDDARLNLLLARILLEQEADPGTAALAEGSAAAARAVRLDPSLVTAHTLLAKADMLAGRTAEAAAECRAALKLDPDDQTALYRLMLASRKLGDIATAHALAERVAAEHDQARTEQSQRLRYRLVETPPPPGAAPR